MPYIFFPTAAPCHNLRGMITTAHWHAGVADADAAGFDPARLQRLTQLLQRDVDAGAIPGAVTLIARRGRLAHHEACGFADRDAQQPMRHDCIFRIASMTKPLTVTAALILMEGGDLLLGDPVARYLPELGNLEVGVESAAAALGERRLGLEPARRAITLQDLMRHTAGFTYGQFGDSLVQRAYRAAQVMDNRQSNAELVTKLAALPLAHQPGTTFEYGMSTDVLGRVVEVVSGMSLDRFFSVHITGPLAMPDTAFGLEPAQGARLAEPQYDPQAPAPAVVPYDPARPTAWFSGGSGLLSTAADYARFCAMLLNGGELDGARVLSRKSVQLMVSNHLPADVLYGPRTAALGLAAPLPELGQGYGLGLGVRMQAGLSPAPGSVGDFYWGGALGPYFWVDPAEELVAMLMLQELNAERRTRYRARLRALVYQALR